MEARGGGAAYDDRHVQREHDVSLSCCCYAADNGPCFGGRLAYDDRHVQREHDVSVCCRACLCFGLSAAFTTFAVAL